MNRNDNGVLLNRLVEFEDKKLEAEYFQKDMKKMLRYLKPLILIFGILDTLFLIPDYFLIKDNRALMLMVIIR
ncbi:MAG: diguanylate cyclase, partial [Clostridiales bacterium]|nr:diguanylate cyclase [Clostridiales bacterium]